MKVFIKIFFVLFCVSCCNCSTKESKYETNLIKANVSRITERLQIMIFEWGTHNESKEFILNDITGYIESKTVYDENDKAVLYYLGASEGLVPYSLYPREGYMPFSERYYKYECKTNKEENYIIDIANPKPGRIEFEQGIDFVTDTIKDFVIITKDKIILSKDDYNLLQKSKGGKECGKRYILYRYV